MVTNKASRTYPVIRSVTSDDATSIARVHIDSWRSTYRGIVPDSVLDSLAYDDRAEVWRKQIEDTTRDQWIYVAEAEEGEIVGFASGGPERTSDYPGFSGEIYALYVDDGWHGHGLGRCLIEVGVRALLEQGHRSMLIWALTENPACGFYRRMGGVPIARQEITAGSKTLEETAFGWENISSVLESG